eukprot:s2829_g1.t1
MCGDLWGMQTDPTSIIRIIGPHWISSFVDLKHLAVWGPGGPRILPEFAMAEAAPPHHDLAEELAALRALTEFQHQEMVEKLDSRFLSLEKLITKPWHGSDAPRRMSYTYMERSAEVSDEPSNQENDSVEPPLSYTSFASHDLKLKECTEVADAKLSRRKFASQKTRSVPEGQKMPNCVTTMVQNPAFDAFFGFVVITNAVFIGIDLEMTLSPEAPDLSLYAAFRMVQYLYTILFTVELLLRIRAADGLIGFLWTDDWHWNCLDPWAAQSWMPHCPKERVL